MPCSSVHQEQIALMPDNDPARSKTQQTGLLRHLWTWLGGIALLLGGIGIFLPVLPTTPFVLVAAFAFTRGSPKLRYWLATHHTFGPIIADWEARGAIATRYKLFACMLMATAFIASLIAGFPPLILAIQGLCLGGAATYILTRPSD